MSDYNKPLPTINDENRPFWEATRRHELHMQKCTNCGHIRYPISHICPACLSEFCEWTKLSGRGEVFAYIVFHQIYHAAFASEVPYNVALVQLEEGPRMFSNVVGVNNNEVNVGDKVHVAFDAVTPEITIPRFRLLRRLEGGRK